MWIYGRVPLGAGGQLTGLHIAPDGRKVVKADVYNGYWWDSVDAKWYPLFDVPSMATYAGGTSHVGAGVWEVCIAPSKTDRVYAITGGYLYRRDGVTHGSTTLWVRTALPQQTSYNGGTGYTNPNGSYKFANQKMVVDPHNPDVVYVHTETNGVQVTFDGGVTFSLVAGITAGTLFGGAGLAIDGNSGTTTVGGVIRSNVVIIPSFGNGVWRSADAGQTWTQISSGSPNPVNVWNGRFGADGVYWCTTKSATTAAYKYASGAWTALTIGSSLVILGVVPDPNTPGRVIFVTGNGKSGFETLDNGSTSVGTWFSGYPGSGQVQTATDIPWLQGSDTSYFTTGDAMIDPTDGQMYWAEGIGVWRGTWPSTFVAFGITSQSLGIEELVATDFCQPPGVSTPMFGVADRCVMRPKRTMQFFPSRYYPVDGAFGYGWEVGYASLDTTFIYALSNWTSGAVCSKSTDGGVTWTAFGSQSPSAGGKVGGSMAWKNASVGVWCGANNGQPFYTIDGGATWNTPTGLPSGVGYAYSQYNYGHIMCCDRGDGTLYIYNWNTPALYKSTDAINWSVAFAGNPGGIASSAANRFRCPTKFTGGYDTTGHIWYCPGQYLGTASVLCYSVNHGASWTNLANITSVRDFAFGKPRTVGPTSYPAIYAYGTVSSVTGLFVSEDMGVTWTQIGPSNPLNTTDTPKIVGADEDTFGRAYLGYAGSGFFYFDASPLLLALSIKA